MQVKTLIVSDIHLGSEHSEAEKLLQLLKVIDCQRVVLNGDIIDYLVIKNKKFKEWPISHTTVIQKLLRFARHGGEVVYVVGNHDPDLSFFLNENIGGISFVEEYELSSDTICFHGHKLDFLVTGKFDFLASIGAIGYEHLLTLNKWLMWGMSKLGIHSEFSLSYFVKKNFKKVTKYIGSFEKFAAIETKKKGYKQCILGHIHHAEDKEVYGIRYINSGCWMNDNKCTYVVEHLDGSLELKTF